MTVRRVEIDGALWPVTGHWCSVCGLPLWRVDGSTTHPTCDPDEPVVATSTPARRVTFAPPTGPGRCTRCGHHIETQGHRAGCPESTAS